MNDIPAPELMLQASLDERHGQFEEARVRLRRVVELAPPDLVLEARLRLGKLCLLGGLPLDSEAELILGAARAQAEQANATPQLAEAIHLLALRLRGLGRSDEAQLLLEKSPVANPLAEAGPERAQWHHYLGLLAADRGEHDQAEQRFFQAYEQYRELQFGPGQAEVCDSLANLLLHRGHTRGALKFADLSLEQKCLNKDLYGQAITRGTQGRIYLLQARYEQARQAFQADLALARKLGDQRGIGIMLNSLGEVARLQKDYAGAEAFLTENLVRAPASRDGLFAELGMARLHLAKGNLDEAAASCQRIEKLLEQQTAPHGLQESLVGLKGALAWRQGDFVRGAQLLEEAIAALDRLHLAPDTIPFLYELRDLHQRQGALAKAVAVMGRTLSLWSECGAERGVKDVENWLRTVDSPELVRLALERHLPEHLVQEILTGHLLPPAPRFQKLTVLFCDVRGYTALAEHLTPQALIELLNDWFTAATRAIVAQGGLVDKFIGDAVMALFGVPDEHEGAGAKAVQAAMAMRDSLRTLNFYQAALGGPPLQIGIGIASGEAVVGFIGSHLRQSYTAIGDVVNTASRLESATKEHQCDILICRQTQEDQSRFEVAETALLSPLYVKGKEQAVIAYRVLGPARARSRGCPGPPQ